MDDRDCDGVHRRPITRQYAGLTVHGILVAALVPALVTVAPSSSWSHPVALVALAAMAVVVDRHDVPLPNGIRLDALIAVALIATALGGPLPALAVVLAPTAINALTGHERLLRAGNLANVAAYGWYTLIGAILVQSTIAEPTAPAALPWLVSIGVVQLVVNWLLGPAIYGPLWLGHPMRALVQMLLDALPAGSVMLALGAGTVVLIGPLGVGALAIFTLIAIVPASVLTYAARTRPVARLDRRTATRRYAHAVAMQLGLSRAERRHLARIAEAAHRRPPTGAPITYAHVTLADPSPANIDAQLLLECWNGNGGPLGLRADAIPRAVRVLAVAQHWSALTAHGTAQLSHRDALGQLQIEAGSRFDPAVVRAVRAVVSQERVSATELAPEPRLHHLRIPAPVRRALAGT